MVVLNYKVYPQSQYESDNDANLENSNSLKVHEIIHGGQAAQGHIFIPPDKAKQNGYDWIINKVLLKDKEEMPNKAQNAYINNL